MRERSRGPRAAGLPKRGGPGALRSSGRHLAQRGGASSAAWPSSTGRLLRSRPGSLARLPRSRSGSRGRRGRRGRPRGFALFKAGPWLPPCSPSGSSAGASIFPGSPVARPRRLPSCPLRAGGEPGGKPVVVPRGPRGRCRAPGQEAAGGGPGLRARPFAVRPRGVGPGGDGEWGSARKVQQGCLLLRLKCSRGCKACEITHRSLKEWLIYSK